MLRPIRSSLLHATDEMSWLKRGPSKSPTPSPRASQQEAPKGEYVAEFEHRRPQIKILSVSVRPGPTEEDRRKFRAEKFQEERLTQKVDELVAMCTAFGRQARRQTQEQDDSGSDTGSAAGVSDDTGCVLDVDVCAMPSGEDTC